MSGVFSEQFKEWYLRDEESDEDSEGTDGGDSLWEDSSELSEEMKHENLEKIPDIEFKDGNEEIPAPPYYLTLEEKE